MSVRRSRSILTTAPISDALRYSTNYLVLQFFFIYTSLQNDIISFRGSWESLRLGVDVGGKAIKTNLY